MKKKKTSILVPILWFLTTALWTITFFISLYHNSIFDGLVLFQGLVMLVSLAAAIMNLSGYLKTKDEE